MSVLQLLLSSLPSAAAVHADLRDADLRAVLGNCLELVHMLFTDFGHCALSSKVGLYAAFSCILCGHLHIRQPGCPALLQFSTPFRVHLLPGVLG